MNANELAEELEKYTPVMERVRYKAGKKVMVESATMLRQQQAEKTMLEGQLKWEREEVERVSAIQIKYAEKIEQQQAEIEALKRQLGNLYRQHGLTGASDK